MLHLNEKFEKKLYIKLYKHSYLNIIYNFFYNITKKYNKKFNINIIIFTIICYILLKSYLYIDFFHIKEEIRNIEKYLKLCNNSQLINMKHFKKVENPKISIISPIYNRENYILRFLRSIQNQFFDDIEIILVDDYSKDNSVKVIKQYQQLDERIILINHYKNKGTFISRNHGVFKAKGKYIMLPDPDDILSEDIIKNCYEISEKYKLEMIRFNIYLGNNNIFFEEIVNKLESRPVYQPELSTYLFYGKKTLQQIDFNVANKFIKRDVYIKAINSLNNFFFNQYMINQEDGIINFVLYRTANSFYFFNKIGYYYLPNEQSITLTFNKNYDDTIRYIFLHLKFVFENTKNNKIERNITNCLFERLYIGVLSECLNLITKDFFFFIDIINMYLKGNYISNENINKLNKLKSIILEKQKQIENSTKIK